MARPKKTDGEIKDQRVPLVMAPSELQELDDWMHQNRIRSRGEAIRRLCQIGMTATRDAEGTRDALMRILNGWLKVSVDVKAREDADLEDDLAPFAHALATYCLRALPEVLATISLKSGEDFDAAMATANKVWTSTGDLMAGLLREAEAKKDANG